MNAWDNIPIAFLNPLSHSMLAHGAEPRDHPMVYLLKGNFIVSTLK